MKVNKYKIGTKLITISDDDEMYGFRKGKIYTVCESKKWPGSYAFGEISDDPGFCEDFIENLEFFKLAKVKNWKKVITNDN